MQMPLCPSCSGQQTDPRNGCHSLVGRYIYKNTLRSICPIKNLVVVVERHKERYVLFSAYSTYRRLTLNIGHRGEMYS